MNGRIVDVKELRPDISSAQNPCLADRVTRMLIAAIVTDNETKTADYYAVLDRLTGKTEVRS